VSSGRSVFLLVPPSEHIAGNRLAFAMWDRFPVTDGHALVIPRREVADWWTATPEERADLLALVDVVKELIERTHQPDGFNVGFNVGDAAGQSVAHLHLHLIPRYSGDVPDPTGGIRNVIPGKANYLEPNARPATSRSPEVLLFDGLDVPLMAELTRRLRDVRFDRIDLVVSFIMRSGLHLVDELLVDALERGARVRVLTTDYLGITDRAALARLLDLSQDPLSDLEVRVFQDPAATSFHPKGYLFWSSRGEDAVAVVGSSNLSRSGLLDGIEWNVGLDAAVPMLERFAELWSEPRSVELTADWLRSYRPSRTDTTLAPVVEVDELPVQPVQPRPIQLEALTALEQTRFLGHRAGLVVMATGLGKTWLAAFDTARPQFRRVLFVAHREEILRRVETYSAACSRMATSGCTSAERRLPMPGSYLRASKHSPAGSRPSAPMISTTLLSTSSTMRRRRRIDASSTTSHPTSSSGLPRRQIAWTAPTCWPSAATTWFTSAGCSRAFAERSSCRFSTGECPTRSISSPSRGATGDSSQRC
jgi:diadenosine tetraphosphate (Ap4A) HIT family hydrolase/HKD family nuclease